MSRTSQHGGVIASVLLSVLAALVICGIVLVGGGLYLARNIEVTEDRRGDRVNIETPFGSLTVHKRNIDPKRLGVPVYPGAELRGDHHKLASVEFDFGSERGEVLVAAAEYTTSDPVEKVRDFYRQQLPNWIVMGKRSGGFQIECREGSYKRLIAINEKHGLTHIALASVGEPASN
jgi:hypothetical protein